MSLAKDGLIGLTSVLRSDYHTRGISASVLILGRYPGRPRGGHRGQKDKPELDHPAWPGRLICTVLDYYAPLAARGPETTGNNRHVLTMRTRERAAPLPSRAARFPCDEPVKPQVKLANIQPRHGPADQHPLDFAGALEDGEDLGVPMPPLDRVLARVAVPAEDLDRPPGQRPVR